MEELNEKNTKVKVIGIQPYENDEYAGITLIYRGNVGVGEYSIYSTKDDKKPLYPNNLPEESQDYIYTKWHGYSEHMDSNDDKWFLSLLLKSLIDQTEIVG